MSSEFLAEGPYAEEFKLFHEANPHVYDILVENARKATGRGYRRVGIRMLWEVMRWQVMMTTRDPSQGEWKLNDHYTRHYARMIMHYEDDLNGVFEVRDKNCQTREVQRDNNERRPTWTPRSL